MLIPRKALVVWGIMASVPFGLAVPMGKTLDLIPQKPSSIDGRPPPFMNSVTTLHHPGNSQSYVEFRRPTQTINTGGGQIFVDERYAMGHQSSSKEHTTRHGTASSHTYTSFFKSQQSVLYKNKNAAKFYMIMKNGGPDPNFALDDERDTSSSSQQNLRIEQSPDDNQEHTPRSPIVNEKQPIIVNKKHPIITELDTDDELHQLTPASVKLPDEDEDKPPKIPTVTQPKYVEKPKQTEPEKKEPEQEEPLPAKKISYPHFMIIVKTRFGMTEKIKDFENYIKQHKSTLHEDIQAGRNVELKELVLAHMSWASHEGLEGPSLYRQSKLGTNNNELIREPVIQMSEFYLDERVQILFPKMTATELKSFQEFAATNKYPRELHTTTNKPWTDIQVEEVYKEWKKSPKDITFHASHLWDKLKHYAISSWEYLRKLFKKDD